MKKKKILFLDMDGVMVDLVKACSDIDPTLDISYGGDNLEEKKARFKQFAQEHDELFETAPIYEGAMEAFNILKDLYDVYFLSTPMWDAPVSYTAKALWIKKHFPEDGFQRLILSHHKHLCHGAILVDDTYNNGADKFEGVHILFGSEEFPNWKETLKTLIAIA